jgi:hypothetical protein
METQISLQRINFSFQIYTTPQVCLRSSSLDDRSVNYHLELNDEYIAYYFNVPIIILYV